MASSMTKVGALACQMNSYAKKLVTRVLSCEAAKVEGQFNVVCADSVLFPEGGGQPSDRGTINETVKVLNVQRDKDTCVITTDASLEVDSEVTMEVDWPRRMDHMQHHTAQHLLTAVVEEMLGLPTTSWALSNPFCHICVPTKQISAEDVKKVEDRCNELIFAATAVVRQTFESRETVPEARSRGIPADVNGPIRLIDIPEVDVCTCCGTHVNTLGELHLLKILHQEPKGNTCRLFFVTGQRLSATFSEMYDREKTLMKEFGTANDNLVASAQRRGKTAADAQKLAKRLAAELAATLAPKVVEQAAAMPAKEIFVFQHDDADSDFVMTLGSAVAKADPQRLAIFGAGDLKKANEGQFIVVGPEAEVKAFGNIAAEALEGKGGASKSMYRGKCNMKKWRAFLKNLPTLYTRPE